MATEDEYIEKVKALVLDNIDRERYAVFLFGGRARGRRGKAVDIDVGILGKASLPLESLTHIQEVLDESSVPLHVDLVDFHTADPQFRTIAMSDIIIWNQPSIIKIS